MVYRAHAREYQDYTASSRSVIYHLNHEEVLHENAGFEMLETYKNYIDDNGIEHSYTYEKIVDFDHLLKEVLNGLKLNGQTSSSNSQYSQFSRKRFHPPQSIYDVLTKSRYEDLKVLTGILGIPLNLRMNDQIHDLMELPKLLDSIESILGLTGTTYLKTKKGSLRCQYVLRTIPLPDQFKDQNYYRHVLSVLSVLRGRWMNISTNIISAYCLIIDKIGLSSFYNVSVNPITEAFILLHQASTSYQKLFTLDAQMHGGLDRWLKAYLDLLLESKDLPVNDLLKILSVIPSDRIAERIPNDDLNGLYQYANSWMDLIGKMLEKEWKSGVKVCCLKGMMVPRRGSTTINVNAWNAGAGAWSNLLRLTSVIERKQGLTNGRFKVLKLTAGDQMSWADSTRKGIDPDCSVFRELTESGFLPWCKNDALALESKTKEICQKYSVNLVKWLPVHSVERKAEVRPDVLSVCGVIVQGELIDIFKEMGTFGSNPWKETKKGTSSPLTPPSGQARTRTLQ